MRKNKRSVKLIALLMAAVLLFVGCGTSNKDKNAAPAGGNESSTDTEFKTTFGDKQFDNATIKVMVYDRNSAPDGMTVVNNRWTDYVNEQMGQVGIKVEFVAIPRNGDDEKVQTMMAAGTAPDVVLSYNRTKVEDYYKQGGLYDLSPYVDGENQAVNLKEYIGKDVLEVGRYDTGELWSVSARRSTSARSNMYIRKDWLDKLGMDIPTTPDELYEALKAFKEKNPGGVEHVVPFASYEVGSLNSNVLTLAFSKLVSDEDEYYKYLPFLLYQDEGYVEFLRFMNKIYNEGLMDQEYYAEGNGDQARREMFVNGQLGFYLYNVNGNVDSMRGDLLQNLKANIPDAEMVSIPPLKNVYDGVQYNKIYVKNGAHVIIPKTCKNPEAAITYLDWMATKEGGFTLFHGFEGEHFDYVDGVPVVKDAAYNATDKDWIRHDTFLIGNQGYYQTEEDFIKATSKEIPGYEKYVVENYEYSTAGKLLSESTFTSPTQMDKSSDFSIVNDENLVKCITCKPEEFDSRIAAYKQALKNAGVEEVFAEREQYYKDNPDAVR